MPTSLKKSELKRAYSLLTRSFQSSLKNEAFPYRISPRLERKIVKDHLIQIPALALPAILNSSNLPKQTMKNSKRSSKPALRAKSIRSTPKPDQRSLQRIGATGPWPFDVEFSGADQTHRFSGGSGAGGNPQNFTRGSALRRAVTAPNGYELVVGDFSNIELRLVAYLSKDPGLVQAIEKHVDIYCDFASVFYGHRISKSDKAERHFGKTAILGLGYGMGWAKFIKTVRVQTGQTITEEESKKAVDLYRTRYGGVTRIWERLDEAISLLALNGTHGRQPIGASLEFRYNHIVLPSGLTIKFPNLRWTTYIDEKTGKEEEGWIYDTWQKGHMVYAKLYGGKLLENTSLKDSLGSFAKKP